MGRLRYKKGDVREIHVMSKTEDDCFPCFICRHALNDLCDRNVKIFSHTYTNSKIVEHTIEELCPYPFDDDNMKGPREVGEEDLEWKPKLPEGKVLSEVTEKAIKQEVRPTQPRSPHQEQKWKDTRTEAEKLEEPLEQMHF